MIIQVAHLRMIALNVAFNWLKSKRNRTSNSRLTMFDPVACKAPLISTNIFQPQASRRSLGRESAKNGKPNENVPFQIFQSVSGEKRGFPSAMWGHPPLYPTALLAIEDSPNLRRTFPGFLKTFLVGHSSPAFAWQLHQLQRWALSGHELRTVPAAPRVHEVLWWFKAGSKVLMFVDFPHISIVQWV